EIVPALKLWRPQENSAVGVRCRAKFNLQDEILVEFPRRPNLPDPRRLGLIVRDDHQRLALGGVTPVSRFGLPVKALVIAVLPAGEVLAVVEADEARVGRPLLAASERCDRHAKRERDEPERSKHAVPFARIVAAS